MVMKGKYGLENFIFSKQLIKKNKLSYFYEEELRLEFNAT